MTSSTNDEARAFESASADGSTRKLKVIAFNTVDQGKIVRVDELTRTI
jgi:hypothetical protein